MMNRKGSASEGVFAFTFLFLIIIMTLGIVSTVYLFYGDGYDSREEEGFILNAKIIKFLMILKWLLRFVRIVILMIVLQEKRNFILTEAILIFVDWLGQRKIRIIQDVRQVILILNKKIIF